MNSRLLLSASLLLWLATARAVPADTTDVLTRLNERYLQADGPVSLSWDNPAVVQLRYTDALSRVGASFDRRGDSHAVDPQRGDLDRHWAFNADTYIHHKASTLWGSANYTNGRTYRTSWSETADLDIVGPFVLADSVVASRTLEEHYRFSGGYASRHKRLYWGARLAYDAGLYYRTVDPRPRNVTSRLDLSGGVGFALDSIYIAAVAFGYTRYSQSNEVTFYSELGNDKLYHLTGLTGDYGRFAGVGYDTDYRGNRWAVMLNFYPLDNEGLVFSGRLSRMRIDNILVQLNKLPLTVNKLYSIDAQLGWTTAVWTVAVGTEASRRVGTENLFGDATGNVYPVIGSLDTYHRNRFAIHLDGQWRHTRGRWDIALRPTVGYDHDNETYIDPMGQLTLNTVNLGLTGLATVRWRRTLLGLTLGFDRHINTENTNLLLPPRAEMLPLLTMILQRADYRAHGMTTTVAGARLTVSLPHDRAINVSLDWSREWYYLSTRRDHVVVNAAFVF